MNRHAIWTAVIILGLAGCGEREQPEAQQAGGSGTATPAAEVAAPAAEVNQAFLDHMHAHADHLDDLMFALADDDLDGAMTPAYWLASHSEVDGLPDEWQQYVTAMRVDAAAVGEAKDLDTAKAAAEKITEHCQACHAAAGVSALRQ